MKANELFGRFVGWRVLLKLENNLKVKGVVVSKVFMEGGVVYCTVNAGILGYRDVPARCVFPYRKDVEKLRVANG